MVRFGPNMTVGAGLPEANLPFISNSDLLTPIYESC